MSESIEFIKNRATKTLSVAKQLAATWTWQEKSLAEFEAALATIAGDHSKTPPIIGQEEVASGSNQES